MNAVAVAHLRVYEPAGAFGPGLQLRLQWAAALSPARIDEIAAQRVLSRVARRVPDPFPPTGERDLIRVLRGHDGGPHFCPDQLALRAALSAEQLREVLDPEVFAALVPEDAIARHRTAVAGQDETDGPGERLRTRSSTWSVPLSWLVALDPDAEPEPVETGQAARRTTDLPDALARLWRAESVLKSHAPEAELLAEVTDLVAWLQGFGQDAVLELDYGRLTRWVWPDESPFDLWALLDALASQDESTAAIAQDRLNRRWGGIALRTHLN